LVFLAGLGRFGVVVALTVRCAACGGDIIN
jgi:hypothetical protein